MLDSLFQLDVSTRSEFASWFCDECKRGLIQVRLNLISYYFSVQDALIKRGTVQDGLQSHIVHNLTKNI